MTFALAFSGCAFISEPPKKLWGSSTEALEKARTNASTQIFSCPWKECYDVVLTMAERDTHSPFKKKITETGEVATNTSKPGVTYTQTLVGAHAVADPPGAAEKMKSAEFKENFQFSLFQARPRERFIVVMGVPGAVDTTEAGIFFTEEEDGRTKVEITSLSTNARIMAADLIFDRLAEHFTAIGERTGQGPEVVQE